MSKTGCRVQNETTFIKFVLYNLFKNNYLDSFQKMNVIVLCSQKWIS